ncbi:hypothetical protein MTO96_025762 [Rhipicephalus appendiculatus]
MTRPGRINQDLALAAPVHGPRLAPRDREEAAQNALHGYLPALAKPRKKCPRKKEAREVRDGLQTSCPTVRDAGSARALLFGYANAPFSRRARGQWARE